MKTLINKIAQVYWRYKFSKKAKIGKNVVFGRHTKIKLSNGSNKDDITIGDNARIFGTIHAAGGKIKVEEDVHFGPYSIIGSTNFVHIKKLAMISTRVDIIDNNNHPVNPYDRRIMNLKGGSQNLKHWRYSDSSPIVIGENTWIGKNSLILKGTNIGCNSVIAANSVVTKAVSANTIVAGNPARKVKENIQNLQRYFNE